MLTILNIRVDYLPIENISVLELSCTNFKRMTNISLIVRVRGKGLTLALNTQDIVLEEITHNSLHFNTFELTLNEINVNDKLEFLQMCNILNNARQINIRKVGVRYS